MLTSEPPRSTPARVLAPHTPPRRGRVNSGSELALRYNDTSVLEHHHTAVAFATIERAGILAHLKDSEYKPLRKLIVSAILATDMGVHKDLLARVVLRATRDAVHGAGSGGFSRASTDDRSLLVCFLLRACTALPAAHARFPLTFAGCALQTAPTCPTRCCRPSSAAASPPSWAASLPVRRRWSSARCCPSPSCSPSMTSAQPSSSWVLSVRRACHVHACLC